jgi:hypothetical protein
VKAKSKMEKSKLVSSWLSIRQPMKAKWQQNKSVLDVLSVLTIRTTSRH